MSNSSYKPTTLGGLQWFDPYGTDGSQPPGQAINPGGPIIPSGSAVASSAYGFSANLGVGGAHTSAGPIVAVSGEGMPAYDTTKAVSSVNRTWSLDHKSPLNPSLTFSASHLVSHAASSGMGVDSTGASSSATLASADLVLSDNPFLPPGIAGVLGLSVSATDIRSTSNVGVVFPNHASASGDASFGSLTISGGLIGKGFTFSGDAAPNTVIYNSSTVTITLDKQVLPGPIVDPVPGPTFLPPFPTAITTEAIDINLHGASSFGPPVYGDIVIGESHAGAPFLISPLAGSGGVSASGGILSASGMTPQDFAAAPGGTTSPGYGGTGSALPDTASGTGGSLPGPSATDQAAGGTGLGWLTGLLGGH